MALLIWTGGALAAVLLAMMSLRSAFLRGRLLFAVVLLASAVVFELARVRGFGESDVLASLARPLLVAGVLVAGVSLLVNPWRQNRASERFPAIVQDVIIIALFGLASTLLFDEKLLTTSAVGAAVVGFALQDTLGNLFSGLAIQIEKPYRVGQWIRVGDYEGKVQEVTWRATKLLTKAGQFAVVPNSLMSKDPILNYSEPLLPTRLEVEVGASYDAPPNVVRRALLEAVDNAPLALRDPEPDVHVDEFSSSSITYRVRFWVEDYARDAAARDQVRSNIWYTFKRHGIEIPFPIQVEYQRDEKPARPAGRIGEIAERLGRIDLFAALSQDQLTHLAVSGREHLFGSGERVVRQGDPGRSMFVVLDGQVRITLEPSGQQVATTSAGGFFGEMSMLTGDPRTATVSALGDAALLEIDADRFRELAVGSSDVVERISAVVSTRRAGLAEAHAAVEGTRGHASAQPPLLSRIRAFLKL